MTSAYLLIELKLESGRKIGSSLNQRNDLWTDQYNNLLYQDLVT